jgi:uncharacterized membrane protein required for colicin V production
VKDGQLLVVDRASVGTGSVVLALLAGFIASVAMVMAFAVAFVVALALSRLPIPVAAGWFDGLTHNQLINAAAPNLYAATAVFFVGGLVWALLYALIFEPRLRGPAWERGVEFALLPWLVSLVIFMPLLGGGLFGISLGAGPLPVIGNLILHALYGAVLGVVWGSAESVVDNPRQQASSEDLQVSRVSILGAALGLLIGLILGTLVGVGVAAFVSVAALNPLAMIVAIGLSGAAFGGFVGSLATS